MSEQSSGGPNYFPTTNWSLVRHAGDQIDQQQSQALQELLTRYWSALRAHLIYQRRLQASDADDFVQGFIENKILEKNLVSAAEPDRGRFRSLLLRSLDNYVNSQYEKMQAKKRAADHAKSLGEQESQLASPTDGDEIHSFDWQWARTVLEQAADRMKDECLQSERTELWAVFHGRILAPIYEGVEPLDYQQIVEQYSFQSPAQASNALMTGKRMYARLLRIVVGQYSASDGEVEEELQDLQRIVSGESRLR